MKTRKVYLVWIRKGGESADVNSIYTSKRKAKKWADYLVSDEMRSHNIKDAWVETMVVSTL